MLLQEVDFSFKIKDNSFLYFDYSFASSQDSRDALIQSAKKQLQDLENILDYQYPRFTSKERDGSITPRTTTFGYIYQPNLTFSIKQGFKTELHYVLSTSPEGTPESLSLLLNTVDFNPERILRVHDSIIGIPYITVSPKAKVQLDRIHSYRSGYDAGLYLASSRHNRN